MCETSVSKREAWRPAVSGLAWKDLLNNASVSVQKWGGLLCPSGDLGDIHISIGSLRLCRVRRSSHPRAGWGQASYTTGDPPVAGPPCSFSSDPLADANTLMRSNMYVIEEGSIVHVSQRSAVPGSTPHKHQTTNKGTRKPIFDITFGDRPQCN